MEHPMINYFKFRSNNTYYLKRVRTINVNQTKAHTHSSLLVQFKTIVYTIYSNVAPQSAAQCNTNNHLSDAEPK